jgi:hypothetical protein
VHQTVSVIKCDKFRKLPKVANFGFSASPTEVKRKTPSRTDASVPRHRWKGVKKARVSKVRDALGSMHQTGGSKEWELELMHRRRGIGSNRG